MVLSYVAMRLLICLPQVGSNISSRLILHSLLYIVTLVSFSTILYILNAFSLRTSSLHLHNQSLTTTDSLRKMSM